MAMQEGPGKVRRVKAKVVSKGGAPADSTARAPRYLSVDRIEGRYVVVIDDSGGVHTWDRSRLPKGVREDDILRREGSRWVVDPEERERRLAKARAAVERLRRKDPGGDIQL